MNIYNKTDYDFSHIERMAELGRSYYGTENDVSDPTYLNWLYLGNPLGKAIISLAYDEGYNQLVGQFARVPLKFLVSGNEILAICGVNSLIMKEYRNLPLYYKLHKTSIDMYDQNRDVFTYAVPNPTAYPLLTRLFSYKTVCYIPLLILPMRPKVLISKRVSKVLSKCIPDVIYKGIPIKNNKKIQVSAIKDANQLDGFWEKIKNKYIIWGVRDKEYLSWRYFNVPCRDYTFLRADDKGETIGFCVVRIKEVEGVKNGMIADFVVSPGRKDAAVALIKKSIGYFAENDAELCGTLMLAHTEESKYLKRIGFVQCPRKFLPQPFPLIVKSLNKHSERLSNPQNWFITMGDYDVV